MNSLDERFNRTAASDDGPPTERIPVYREDFDSPNSLTRAQIEQMLRSGQIEAFLAWNGFDLKTLFAVAMDSLGTRQEQDLAEISEGWRQIEEIRLRIQRAEDRARQLEVQSRRLNRLRAFIR